MKIQYGLVQPYFPVFSSSEFMFVSYMPLTTEAVFLDLIGTKVLRIVIVSHLWCEHFYRLLYSSRDTEKGGRRGKRHSTDKREWGQQLFSLQGYWVPHSPGEESGAYQGPPPLPHPRTPHCRILAISGNLGQSPGRPHLGAWKCCSWIWTAIVIMYEFSVQW